MDIKHKLSGESGQLTQRVINISVIGMLDRNPGMLSAIRCRDIAPARENTPWAGEYAGKHLTACALLYKLTGNEKLMEYGTGLADGLIGCQDGDGYLGVADKSHRLTGTYQQSVDYYVTVRRTIDYIPRENPEITLWDCWSHYHSVAGLLMWYDITGNDRYADAAKKAADLLMKTFYTPDRRAVSSSGFDVTAYSIYHMFALLYTRYHSPEYYSFLKKMESEIKSFEHNYFDNAISGGEFSKTVSPRWESLYIFIGIGELYRFTGDENYYRILRNTCENILDHDIHNTGAFFVRRERGRRNAAQYCNRDLLRSSF